MIEIDFLQGDVGLLRERRADFGRAIAHATFQYLNIDPHCADWAAPHGWNIVTYFPADSRTNTIELQNDGLLDWKPLDYILTSVGNAYGTDVQYLLPTQTAINEVAAWEVPVIAPSSPGIYRQDWQLTRGSHSVGMKTSVYIIVVPQEAQELSDDLDRHIEELRQRGDQELDEFLDTLEDQAVEWITGELLDLDCLTPALAVGMLFSVVVLR